VSQNLDLLFSPKSVAVVGATPRRDWGWSNGNSWIAGSVKQGFSGSIYPVHPKAESIMGYPAYPSIMDIPAEIDLAIFTIPMKSVLAVLKECIQKKVKFVHLLTAGFSETGDPELKKMEDEIVETAKEGGVRLIGPNCMGLYCPAGGLSWSVDFPKSPGSVSFFSQSGQLAYGAVASFRDLKPRFNKVVSFGNACDLQAHDFLTYLAEDDQTKVIGAYLEGLREGRPFFEAARQITRQKPMVVWKGGQTEGGGRAIQSHTAAIAGSQIIWDAVCAQAGIISVDSMEEITHTIEALEMMKLPTGTRTAILGGAGGGSVTMTDISEKEGLSVPSLEPKTLQRLGEFIPVQGSSFKNPLDIVPTLYSVENIARVMEILRDDQNIDIVLFHISPAWLYNDFGSLFLYQFMEKVLEGGHILQKPLYMSLEKSSSPQISFVHYELIQWLNQRNVAIFPSFILAARTISRLNRYRQYIEQPED